jgi:hypothetical protein
VRVTKKLRVLPEKPMEEDLERRANSAMRLAMDTLDRGLEAVKSTHRSAKRLKDAMESTDTPHQIPRFAVAKK